jgi:hypothetical protein
VRLVSNAVGSAEKLERRQNVYVGYGAGGRGADCATLSATREAEGVWRMCRRGLLYGVGCTGVQCLPGRSYS